MDPDRQTLNAFVDGTLPPDEMRRIAVLLASRSDLESYVLHQEQLRIALKARFDSVLNETVPSHLITRARSAPLSWRWRINSVVGQWGLRPSLISAGVALMLGLVVGFILQPKGDVSLTGSGSMIAQGALAEALDTKLAAAGRTDTGPQVGVSFRDKTGRDCRTFSTGTQAGLACHTGIGWVVAVLVNEQHEDAGAPYQMASATMPNAVRQEVEARISGAPFDATAEALARDRGWSGR
jgi:hypothetical protein